MSMEKLDRDLRYPTIDHCGSAEIYILRKTTIIHRINNHHHEKLCLKQYSRKWIRDKNDSLTLVYQL